LELANHQLVHQKEPKFNMLRIQSGEETYEILASDVVFFEYAGSRRIRLYTSHGVLEYGGTLKKMENENIDFFHCHSHYVINVKRIKEIHRRILEIEMDSGEFVPVSIEKLRMLLNRLEIK